MKMKTYKSIIFVLIFGIIIFLPNLAVISQDSQFDLVDKENDVMEIIWNSDTGDGTYRFVSDQPNIDIIGINYQLSPEKDIILNVTVKGNIQVENTYYWVIINSKDFHINVWFGSGYSAASTDKIAGFDYSNATQFVEGNVTYAYLNSTLSLTLSSNNHSLIFPSQASNEWGWQVTSWYGQNSLEKTGTWYFDYVPDSENKYTGTLTPQNANGFEFIAIGIGIFTIYFIKKSYK